MKRTLPDAVDGESDPKTASWRDPPRGHDEGEDRDAADGGRERDRGRPRAGRSARHASDPRRRRGRAPRGRAGRRSATSVARPASSPAPTNARVDEPRSAAGAEPERADDERLEEREVVRLGHVDGRQQRDRGQDPGTHGDRRLRAPKSRAIAQVSGAAIAPISANGSAEAQATSPKTAMNGTWTIDASGIQWAFDGIGSDRVGRDRAADLGEDPDEVDVEAGAGMEAPGDVDVVGRIRGRRGTGNCAISTNRTARASPYRSRGIRTAGAA